MDGDGIAEDRSETALGRGVERVLEQPAEDTEAPIGGVDDCGTRLGGGDTRARHQRVMPDYSPLVDGDRRQQLARGERRHQVPRPVEVGVHIAQVVVLVEELGDRLAVPGRSGPHLDRVGELLPPPVRAWARPRCGAASPVRSSLRRTVTSAASRFPSEPRFISSTLRTSGARAASDSGSGPKSPPALVSGRPQSCTATWTDPSPDSSVNLDLAEVVVRVRVVKREADELLDDRAEPPLVLCGDSASGCKRREDCQHQRRRARVAEDGDLYPRHGKAMLEAEFGLRLPTERLQARHSATHCDQPSPVSARFRGPFA